MEMEYVLLIIGVLLTMPLWLGPVLILLLLSIPLAIVSVPIIAVAALIKYLVS